MVKALMEDNHKKWSKDIEEIAVQYCESLFCKKKGSHKNHCALYGLIEWFADDVYTEGYSAGHEQQMQMRLADAKEKESNDQ